MSGATCLLAYSLGVLVLGAPLLRRLSRSGHAPRLGVAAWVTATASVLLSWIAAVALAAVDVVRNWNEPGTFFGLCFDFLHDALAEHAGANSGVGPLLVLMGFMVTAGLGVRLTRTLARLRERTREHAEAVRIVGRRTAERDVVVVEDATLAAYSVPGRPPAIVLTRGAVEALDNEELAAVLAHERAHLAGHHTHLVAALRSLALVFPRFRLMTDAAEEVPRLLEMCADDAAVRRHGRQALLSSLARLTGAAPAAALGAAQVAVLTRARRLMLPPAPLARTRTWAAFTLMVGVAAAGPLVTVTGAGSGALLCSP